MPLNINQLLDKITTPISFGEAKPYQVKRYFKIFINFNFIAGFFYAFYFYLISPKPSQMFERRLWAFECWAILSFYGIFIYLFYLEKSALENQGLYRFSQIQAKELIDAPVKQVEEWLRSLESNPEKYQFDTHQGVRVLSGKLSKVGAVFATKEKFLGMMMELKFQVVKVSKSEFEFVLISLGWLKKLGVRGKFVLVPVAVDQTVLQLIVFNKMDGFGKRIMAMMLLYLSPVRFLVARQIGKEVRLVKREVEKEH